MHKFNFGTIHSQTICQQSHSKPCVECYGILSIAQTIVENGFVVMSTAFWDAFPGVKYSAEVACCRFLQMPLVYIIVGEQKCGRSLG